MLHQIRLTYRQTDGRSIGSRRLIIDFFLQPKPLQKKELPRKKTLATGFKIKSSNLRNDRPINLPVPFPQRKLCKDSDKWVLPSQKVLPPLQVLSDSHFRRLVPRKMKPSSQRISTWFGKVVSSPFIEAFIGGTNFPQSTAAKGKTETIKTCNSRSVFVTCQLESVSLQLLTQYQQCLKDQIYRFPLITEIRII